MDEHKNKPNTASTKTATLADGTVMTKKLFKNLEKQAQKLGNKTKQINAAARTPRRLSDITKLQPSWAMCFRSTI